MQVLNAELKDFATFTVQGENGLVVRLTEEKPVIELKLQTLAGDEDDTAVMRAFLVVSPNGMYNVYAESAGMLPFGILHRLYLNQTSSTKDNVL